MIGRRRWITTQDAAGLADERGVLAIPAARPACAGQRNWRTPCCFVQCPEAVTAGCLGEYLASLMPGAIFSQNRYGETRVVTAAATVKGRLSIVSEGDISPIHKFGLCIVSIDRGVIWHHAFEAYHVREDALHFHELVLRGRLP